MVAELSTLGTNEAYERENGRIRRRIDRFRRAGMFGSGSSVTIERATTAEDLIEAYRLVHDVFVQRDYILPQTGGMRIRPVEALPEMATFIARAEGKIVAVMSIVPDTAEFGLPSDKAFQDELDSLRAQGRRISEITNLAVDPSYRNGAIFLELTRVILAYGVSMGYDDGFVSISEEHAIFFDSVLGFDPFGERRNYGAETEDYVVGMRLNAHEHEAKLRRMDDALGDGAFLHDWFYAKNPYFELAAQWNEAATREFLKPALLGRLFADESRFLERCDESVLAGLRLHWGSWLLDVVVSQWAPAPEMESLAAA